MPGSSVATIAPWVIAMVCVGVVVTQRGTTPPAPVEEPRAADADEIRRLRLRLATSRAENGSLRRELDRLVSRISIDLAAGDGTGSPSARAGNAPAPTEDLRSLENALQAAVDRAAAEGGESAEVADLVIRMLRHGAASFEALREAYQSSADATVRALIARALVASPGSEVAQFLVAQYMGEENPVVRGALVRQAARVATPSNAEVLKQALLQALTVESEDAVRVAAVRGLRYAAGEDVLLALRDASYDPSEELRLAVMDNMALRPEMRAELEESLSNDPSERVRDIGRCRQLLDENP